ncbi:hypothetical protein [Streptomyces tsukubensis]|uniref:DUF308 domain-containing protein n=1 Tax=Streptomyces tsukubensis TaxID=83656 RepID=A0A1V4A6T8_9ACTN|nr:hypothetical protein [Streptomyces tsukubensis]OON77659.1 hypothetical protein B1H18_18185 [Streptomyces tsukubensis]QFR93168.1 hypothetical protein GBW32_08820 [Streptomyces tsukubensis]
MAEHGADSDESREPEESGVPFDEDAAWAAIVAGYGDEPPDPPGAKPFKSVEGLAGLDAGVNGPATAGTGDAKNSAADADKIQGDKVVRGDRSRDDTDGDSPAQGGGDASADRPLGGSIAFAPGVGPRDHSLTEPSDGGQEDDDEGHFVPPEPPPLPSPDVTAKFAWLAVIGGPVLALVAVLLGWPMTWWLATLTIGGFVGGFCTLVARMKGDDEIDDDPGRGAVV